MLLNNTRHPLQPRGRVWDDNARCHCSVRCHFIFRGFLGRFLDDFWLAVITASVLDSGFLLNPVALPLKIKFPIATAR